MVGLLPSPPLGHSGEHLKLEGFIDVGSGPVYAPLGLTNCGEVGYCHGNKHEPTSTIERQETPESTCGLWKSSGFLVWPAPPLPPICLGETEAQLGEAGHCLALALCSLITI